MASLAARRAANLPGVHAAKDRNFTQMGVDGFMRQAEGHVQDAGVLGDVAAHALRQHFFADQQGHSHGRKPAGMAHGSAT